MTLQDLKNNREEIISIIKRYRTDSESIKEVMNYMVQNISSAETEFVSTYTEICLQELGFDRISNDSFLKTKLSESSENYMKSGIKNEY